MAEPQEDPRQFPDGDPHGLTSAHVRRAKDGEAPSVAWIVERLSPLLLAHAAFRLGPQLRVHHDPQDLVDDAWMVALPRLPDIAGSGGRHTPALLRFLTTTILYRVNNLARKHLRGGAAPESGPETGADGALDRLPADLTGVVTAAARREVRGAVAAALARLDERDREILLLRGIEQQPNGVVAGLLGLTPQAVSMRFQRALERLRAEVPESVFGELGSGY